MFFDELPDTEAPPSEPARPTVVAQPAAGSPFLCTSRVNALDFTFLRFADTPALPRYLPLSTAIPKPNDRVAITQHVGNVWEWCSNLMQRKTPKKSVGCCAAAPGTTIGTMPRAGARIFDLPGDRYDNIGFRVVCCSHIHLRFSTMPSCPGGYGFLGCGGVSLDTRPACPVRAPLVSGAGRVPQPPGRGLAFPPAASHPLGRAAPASFPGKPSAT